VALKTDGTVWAWGLNDRGQLGNGTIGDGTNKNTPVQVSNLSGVKAIAAFGDFSLALKEDGTVWAWGRNTYGQLGDRTTTDRSKPVPVSGLSGVKAIAAGFNHGLALKTDGTVWAWGLNNRGQLGDGTTTMRNTPVQVKNRPLTTNSRWSKSLQESNLSGVKAIDAGLDHSLALMEDGTVRAWGSNGFGKLGDGTSGTDRHTPVQVKNLSGVQAIAAGSVHSQALKTDGTVWAWGWDSEGQLGNETTTQSNIPVPVSGLSGVKAIAAGYYHGLALKTDGTVWAWGRNDDGQMGDGTSGTDRHTPVQVKNLGGVQAIAAGGWHNLAIVFKPLEAQQ
jgi:alpha-tubulin suppressor-like RCC1 family protein